MLYIPVAAFLLSSVGLISHNVLNDAPDTFLYQCKTVTSKGKTKIEYVNDDLFTKSDVCYNTSRPTVINNNYYGSSYGWPMFWDDCYWGGCHNHWGWSTPNYPSTRNNHGDNNDDDSASILFVIVLVLFVILSAVLLVPLHAEFYCNYFSVYTWIFGISFMMFCYIGWQLLKRTRIGQDKKQAFFLLECFIGTSLLIQIGCALQSYYIVNVILLSIVFASVITMHKVLVTRMGQS